VVSTVAGGAFVGRATASAVLTRALDEAADGRPRVVVVAGPAGIGKSALVDHFLATARPRRVIRVQGVEQEMTERFAIAAQLLRQARGTTASGRVPVAEEIIDVGGELLRALTAEPVAAVAVVDDAHWADAASIRALSFALRRLESDPVLAVLCVRPAGLDLEPIARLAEVAGAEVVHLEPLTGSDVQQLCASAGIEVSAAAARRLRDHTGGLPLHVSALLRELDPAVLTRTHGPLPAPLSFATLVLSRLAAQSSEAEALVAGAAVLGRADVPVTTAVEVGGVSDVVAALDGVVAAGVLEHRWDPSGDTVRFPHDLVRAAVLEGLAPGRRMELHRRAAGALDGVAALDQRAAATVLPDRLIASDLERAARTEAAEGATERAVRHLLEASRLSGDPAKARGLRLDGLEVLVLAGEVRAADGLAADLKDDLEAGDDPSRRDYLRGHLALLGGRRVEAEELLLRAWETASPDRSRLAALVAAQLSQLCTAYARSAEAVQWAERVSALAGDDPQLDTAAVGTQLVSLVIGGRPDEALRRTVPPEATEEVLRERRFDHIGGRGIVRLWTDDLTGACGDLAAVAAPGLQGRPLRVRLVALGFLAEAQYRGGWWDRSESTGDLAVSLAEDTDHAWLLGFLHGTASFALSGRGTWDLAAAHVASAQTAAAVVGDVMNIAWTAVAATALAHARGDHDAVIAASDAIASMDAAHGALEPGVLRWCPERAEALVAKGRIDEAVRLLDAAEALARTRDRQSALVALGRARGVAEAARDRPIEALAVFREAAERAHGSGMPFDLALARPRPWHRAASPGPAPSGRRAARRRRRHVRVPRRATVRGARRGGAGRVWLATSPADTRSARAHSARACDRPPRRRRPHQS